LVESAWWLTSKIASRNEELKLPLQSLNVARETTTV
jgi:hypothetical protein